MKTDGAVFPPSMYTQKPAIENPIRLWKRSVEDRIHQTGND